MSQLEQCPFCKEKNLEEQQLEDVRVIAGFTFKACLSAYECLGCKEQFFQLEELGRFDKEISGWLAQEGILSGEAFRFMRKTIGFRAKELAKLLDLRPETLSRWEKGHRQPDKKAMMVMGDLVLDFLKGKDTTLQRLKRLGSSSRTTDRIELDLSLCTA